jgi:hypothetical protein
MEMCTKSDREEEGRTAQEVVYGIGIGVAAGKGCGYYGKV